MEKQFFRECLSYPLRVDVIQRKKKSIRRELMQDNSFVEKRIAILGGSTTDEIKDLLELFLLKEGIKPLFYQGGFNRFYEEVHFDNGKLKQFKPDIVYIHTSNVNIDNYPATTDTNTDVDRKLSIELSRFESTWERIKADYNCTIIQNNFELPDQRPLGNLDFIDIHGKTRFIMSLNLGFAKYAQEHQNLYINDINYLSAWLGLEKWHDRQFWYSYKYAQSYDAIVHLSHNVAKIVVALTGKSKKCLVLDLDNTLWGGVIGDDGVDNIKIGKETPEAEAYSALQNYIQQLKERGVLLAVCSKNDTDVAREGFAHPDSVLRYEDFVAFKANWAPKHVSLLDIASDLNIGMDSLVFLDDNPVERELVKAQTPDVEVPELTNEVGRYIDFLDKQGYFEPIHLSVEDMKRSEYYQSNAKRQDLQGTFTDYGEFLRSLKMTAEIRRFDRAYFDRITQLINKTNQFNLTTKRCTRPEVEAMAADAASIALYGKLSDKFGDNGLVSVVTGSILGSELQIDIWLMSCRVIKREFELAIFDELVRQSMSRGLTKIIGHYRRSPKNDMVATHYSYLGFELLSESENGDSVWGFDIRPNYESKNKLIAALT